MSTQALSHQILVPDYFKPTYLYEGLGCGASLISRHVPKRKNPGLQPGMLPKLSNTLIVQMLAKTSAGGAQAILGGDQEVLLAFSKVVLTLPDPVAALKEVVSVLSSENPPSVFSVSPPTVSAHLNRFPVSATDLALIEQVKAIQVNLRERGQWPDELMLTADPMDTPYCGRFINQYTNWGRRGNQPTYKRVFKEFGIYAMPVQLQVGFAPLPINSKKQRELPAWIRNIGFAVAWLSAAGTRVPIVAVDREFYSGVGFGAAYLGKLAPALAAADQPRLLCPRKLWHSNRDPKWEFLTGKNSADVSEDAIEIRAGDETPLGPAADRLAMGDNGKRRVPVAVIAAFDIYSKKKEPKSLVWARTEGVRINTELIAVRKALVDASTGYQDYTREVLGKERVPPKGNGKRRRVFQDTEEATRYWACVAAREAATQWEAKKGKLCKRLVFFTASLREGEHVVGREGEFLNLIRQYREHWNIENGFKSQKWQFRVHTNCRKTTARHARAILGAMFYNAWHYRRLCQVARLAKESDPSWKAFDESTPPLRKKYERKFRPALSAQGYLLQELQRSMKICIETFISQNISV